MKQDCNVVIGAGPAGSAAAHKPTRACLSMLLLVKRQEIGPHVRYAEADGRETLAGFVTPEPRRIAAEAHDLNVTIGDGDCVVLPPPEETLERERKRFDSELAHAAARASADVDPPVYRYQQDVLTTVYTVYPQLLATVMPYFPGQ